MTREDMIGKVLHSVINKSFFNDDRGWVNCPFCGESVHDSCSGLTIEHKGYCDVLLARQILATPVIEVGDVVKIQESDDEYYVCGIVQQYGYSYPWYELSKESPWANHEDKYKNPTLVRKGGYGNNFERKEK